MVVASSWEEEQWAVIVSGDRISALQLQNWEINDWNSLYNNVNVLNVMNCTLKTVMVNVMLCIACILQLCRAKNKTKPQFNIFLQSLSLIVGVDKIRQWRDVVVYVDHIRSWGCGWGRRGKLGRSEKRVKGGQGWNFLVCLHRFF